MNAPETPRNWSSRSCGNGERDPISTLRNTATSWSRKARIFWPLAATLFLTDCASKRAIVNHLDGESGSLEVWDGVVRFTLVFNRNAAMSLPIGPNGRWLLAAAGTLVLLVLARLYWHTAAEDRWQSAALALVVAGAAGNVSDRLRWDRGVVDFIDLGVGSWRFYVFNVADVGVVVGASLLALVLARREASLRREPPNRA